MKRRVSIIAIGLFVLVNGCAHQPKPAPATQARNDFEKSKDPPIAAQTYLAAGQLAESQGRLVQASQQYSRALWLKPDYQEAMYRQGVVLTELKNYPQAIQMWNKYVEATGGDATAYSNLGFCQELALQFDAAELSYKRGIAKDPHNEACHVNYGLMLARKGRGEAALLQLQTVLSPAEAHYDLGSVYEIQKRKQDALSEYHKAIELDPNLEEAKAKIASIGE